ncbi:MAG: flavin-dependent monooxygenase [Candidatus Dadabacteria bacterium]|nr:MAG: flavin-dependent monooxygenase [Candidatus Dadabacteria bacterium]
MQAAEVQQTAPPGRKELIARAEAMVPRLIERVPETTRMRMVHPDTIAELQEAGFFRALQPARWGGLELDPTVFFDIAAIISSACPSTAWVLGVVSVHSWQLALFPDQAQQDVWADDSSVLISSSYMPVGKVRRVDGGFMLSGQWGFSSGVDHCDWAMLGAFAADEDGNPDHQDLRTFLVPKTDFEVVDDWFVSGLQGTGSKSVKVTEKFVPEYRTHKFADGFRQSSPGHAENTAPLFRIPFGQLFVRAVASNGIGMLTGALREFIAVQKARVARSVGARVAENPQAQQAAAQAAATLKELKLVFYDQLNDMMDHVRDGKKIPLEKRVQWRYEASLVGPKSRQAIDDLFRASGGSAIYDTNPIQRFFNDMHAAEAHYVNNPFKPACNFGSVLLGGENTDFFI